MARDAIKASIQYSFDFCGMKATIPLRFFVVWDAIKESIAKQINFEGLAKQYFNNNGWARKFCMTPVSKATMNDRHASSL